MSEVERRAYNLDTNEFERRIQHNKNKRWFVLETIDESDIIGDTISHARLSKVGDAPAYYASGNYLSGRAGAIAQWVQTTQGVEYTWFLVRTSSPTTPRSVILKQYMQQQPTNPGFLETQLRGNYATRRWVRKFASWVYENLVFDWHWELVVVKQPSDNATSLV